MGADIYYLFNIRSLKMDLIRNNPFDYVLIALVILSTIFQWLFLQGKVTMSQKRIYGWIVFIGFVIIEFMVLWTVFGFKNLFR